MRNDRELAAAIETISVDAYGDDEQYTAFLTVLEEQATLADHRTVLGTPVTVTGFDYTNEAHGVIATCRGPDGARRWTPAQTPPSWPPGSPRPRAERRLAEQRDKATPPKVTETGDRLSQDEIVAIVEELGDMVTALRDAEPEHKLDVYRNLGLRLTYDPETRTVRADIDLACVRGGT